MRKWVYKSFLKLKFITEAINVTLFLSYNRSFTVLEAHVTEKQVLESYIVLNLLRNYAAFQDIR